MKKTVYVVSQTAGSETYLLVYDNVNDISDEFDGEEVGVYELVRTERFRVNRYLEEENDDG